MPQQQISKFCKLNLLGHLKRTNLITEFATYVKSLQCLHCCRKHFTRKSVVYFRAVYDTWILWALDVLLGAFYRIMTSLYIAGLRSSKLDIWVVLNVAIQMFFFIDGRNKMYFVYLLDLTFFFQMKEIWSISGHWWPTNAISPYLCTSKAVPELNVSLKALWGQDIPTVYSIEVEQSGTNSCLYGQC